MMKKLSLALLAMVSIFAAQAAEYVGTYKVTTANYTRNGKSMVVTKTAEDVYDVTVKNFTVVLMNEVHQVGDVTFYSMIGTTDEEGYVTVSGSTKLDLDQLIDMEDLGDLGFGDISAYITNQSYPVNLSARFNYKNMNADMSVTVVISIMGFYELLNETCRINFVGQSNEDPPVVYALGDVNGDGTVDVSDVNILINIALDMDSPENYGNRAYITEGDTLVDIADINALISLLISQ